MANKSLSVGFVKIKDLSYYLNPASAHLDCIFPVF